jgi:hypothetical protein
MEDFQNLIFQAKKTISAADHMLIMTFPLVKDPKILLAVLSSTFSALTNATDSLVTYERVFKRIPPPQDTFESKFNVFKDQISKRYNINSEYIKLILEIKEILNTHKKSPIEFSRNDRFIICTENYRMKTISVEELKKYIAKTKMYITEIERLVNKNAGIFK